MENIDLIALAGLLHDVGKFGQRAEINIERDNYDFQNYCPMKFGTYWTHQHSAYTADFLKNIVLKQNEFSFIDPKIENEGFENISAKHHKPTTDLEWIVAIADRVSSGFERDEFNNYNNCDDRGEKLKYYEVPLDGVFDKDKKNKFPLGKFDTSNIYARNITKYSKAEYNNLYKEFIKDLEILKKKPKSNFMYGLEYLLKKYTSFIPSSTYKTKANIPLYDHLKATSAFSATLYRFYKTHNDISKIKDYNSKNYLLIAGDFFGIQKFIFSSMPTSKASKLLRGKSAFIQIFTQIVSFYIADKLELSYFNIISTTAGKFEILAPNIDSIKKALEDVKQDLNEWFIKNTFGESGIGVSFIELSSNDFVNKNFHSLRDKLSKQIEKTKYQKFDLKNKEPIINFDEDKIKDNAHLCPTCNTRFKNNTDSDKSCEFCNIFIKLGEKLAKASYIQIRKDSGDINIFEDYFIEFSSNIDKKTKVVYDISNEEDFKGYSKWALKAYVKYSEVEKRIEEFEELALESCEGSEEGVKALMSLKGDVDNMGNFLNQSGIDSFAKYNFLSRLIDYFFSVKASQMMQGKNLYTIFAGGDDIFIIGAWDEVIGFAKELRDEFMRFVDGSELTFSVGMVMFKPNKPINYIAKISEKALEKAKEIKGENRDKDSITLFCETVQWDDYLDDMGLYDELKNNNVNTAFLYRVLDLIEMSKKVKYQKDIKSTMWKSKLAYSFARNNLEDSSKTLLNTLDKMIEDYPKEAKMRVFEYIYKRREK